MKNNIILLLLATVFVSGNVFAKKVKFACDMTGIVIAPTGMHISGDFQTVAGFAGGDWNSASTPLTQEPGTDIYSIIVDIPAFTKYEYKFVNGDQFYEVEFVPEYSRVGYNFNDNRWIYIDSLANDTTFVGAIIFGGNAPDGFKLVRYHVDMSNENVSANGVHVAGTFQGWDPASTILYSFGNNVYEMICYMPVGVYEYKFYNGNILSNTETVPSGCAVNGNREINVTDDVLVPLVCYSSCDPCLTGVKEVDEISIQIRPNPATEQVYIQLENTGAETRVSLVDLSGKSVRTYKKVDTNLLIERKELESGLYFIQVTNSQGGIATSKLIFN